MASSSLALFLTLSLLLLLLDIAASSSCGGYCRGRPSTPFPPGQGPFPPGQGPFPPGQGPNTPFPPGQGPFPPGQGPNTPFPPGQGPNTPFPPGQGPNTPSPPGQGPNTPLPPGQGRCPRDALKLGVCANVLGLVNATIGAPPRLPCCSLLGNLVDLEAAVCLCTAIRGNVLGINLNIPITLSLVLNYCGVGVPPGFQC